MNSIKKTKIVCTIGPVTESEKSLSALIKAGMNVMRLNFSHGDFAEHQVRIDNLKKITAQTSKSVAVLQDLSGPKIRIGTFENGSVILKAGSTFTITTEKVVGNEKIVSINYPLFAKEVKVGDPILLHDGKKELVVTAIKNNQVICKVLVGGEIKDKRGVNLPGSELSVSSIIAKDRVDVKFGLKNKVDFFALSFVRRPEDILELRSILNKNKSQAKIIAKIETPQAVKNIDEILNLADGIMVARGDLAIEVPASDVPVIQKSLIKKCNILGKPVITATQMLESMIDSPVPTRAEVSDVANAILDGTDAIMLSEETTLGKYPVEAVSMMAKIAETIERDDLHKEIVCNKRKSSDKTENVSDAICNEVVDIADRINAKFIVALTESGYTARMISRYKPSQRILACTPNPVTHNQLLLSFGCLPFTIPRFKTLMEAESLIRKTLLQHKIAKKGDKIVILAGMPFAKTIATNMLLVQEI